MPAKKSAKKANMSKKAAKKTAKKKAPDGDVMSPGVLVVNMIPKSRSGEHNQDSEPNLAVDPAAPLNMVGSAFTPDPGGGPDARTAAGVDVPSTRPTLQLGGTGYGTDVHRGSARGTIRRYDVGVVRYDTFGTAANPFTAWKDPSDGLPGRRLVLNLSIPWRM